MKTKMIKKFIALSLAVLVMASNMVSAYAAYDIPDVPMHNSTNQWTENKVTGAIKPYPHDSHFQTFIASTKANKRYDYISAQIFLEDAETNASIATKEAYGVNLDSADVEADVTYGYNTYVRVTGISRVGSSKSNITTEFGVRNIFKL